MRPIVVVLALLFVAGCPGASPTDAGTDAPPFDGPARVDAPAEDAPSVDAPDAAIADAPTDTPPADAPLSCSTLPACDTSKGCGPMLTEACCCGTSIFDPATAIDCCCEGGSTLICAG